MPVSRQLVDDYRKRLLAGDELAREQVRQAYADAAREVMARIGGGGADLSRQQELLKYIAEQLEWAGDAATARIAAAQAQGLNLSFEHAQGHMQAAARGVFSGPDREALFAMVGATKDGTPVAEVLRKHAGDAAAEAAVILRRSVILGRSPTLVAEMLAPLFGATADRAEIVARTEMMRAYRTGLAASYFANEDVFGRVRWVAAHQPRTCAICLALDGKVWQTKWGSPLDVPVDSHPNCRCTIVPIVRGEPEDVDLRETGVEWLERQPEEVQRATLGNWRYEWFSNKMATLDSMIEEDRSGPFGRFKMRSPGQWADATPITMIDMNPPFVVGDTKKYKATAKFRGYLQSWTQAEWAGRPFDEHRRALLNFLSDRRNLTKLEKEFAQQLAEFGRPDSHFLSARLLHLGKPYNQWVVENIELAGRHALLSAWAPHAADPRLTVPLRRLTIERPDARTGVFVSSEERRKMTSVIVPEVKEYKRAEVGPDELLRAHLDRLSPTGKLFGPGAENVVSENDIMLGSAAAARLAFDKVIAFFPRTMRLMTTGLLENVRLTKSPRSYAARGPRGKRSINLSEKVNNATIAHEAMHVYESWSSERFLQIQYRAMRGGPVMTLAEAKPAYSVWEDAGDPVMIDKWATPYTGKMYPKDRATEIMPTAIEQLFTPHIDIQILDDPGFTSYLVGMLLRMR